MQGANMTETIACVGFTSHAKLPQSADDRQENTPEPSVPCQTREQEMVALVRRLRQGDQVAYVALYDATRAIVYGVALRILQDQGAAEDVTIEVYTQVYQQASHYDPNRGTPSAWLLTLTRSRAIDRLRVEIQRREREKPLEGEEVIASVTLDPEQASSMTQLKSMVCTALAVLTPEQRQIVEIAYYEGLSHSAIAARLGQPLGTVKTRIRTALKVLRKNLHPLLNPE